jgi:hypothetical protein
MNVVNSMSHKLRMTTQALFLDLGEVKEIAEVELNGTDFGVLWKPPFVVEVTHAVRPGRNHLVVRITNLCPNCLIGGQRLPPEKRRAWTTWSPSYEGLSSPAVRPAGTGYHADRIETFRVCFPSEGRMTGSTTSTVVIERPHASL